jgi:TolB-like protein/class 3 adenylate cyclase/cytochrome c-type biogenesis protein CcmH/NrfG
MAKDRLSGKLAVILHADVAGSTALVQQDEQLAHERIQDAFQRFSRNIEKYHGLVHELRGDALLAEFERASDAVAATLAFQADQAYNNSRLPDDLQPKVRVGISLGEVVIADNTVTGAGVVLAQRVEQLADAGGLCITAALHEALPRRMPFELEDLGEQTLKGFDDSVHVYKVELSQGALIPTPAQEYKPTSSTKSGRLKIVLAVILVGVVAGIIYWLLPLEVKEEPASVERMAFPLPDKPSIAVMPFTNMSDDPKQEYFVDGMTEDLITDLSKLSSLFVIARNSVFTYKGKPVKVQQVAEELGVRYIVEGSVRRVGNQVRINAQLIDATTGGHLWADRYDRNLSDIFALQNEVMVKIVSALQIRLGVSEQARLAREPTNNLDAYDLYLRAEQARHRYTLVSLGAALGNYGRATSLDPDFAEAHAGYARTAAEFLRLIDGFLTLPSDVARKRAYESVTRALSLDPELAEPHSVLGVLHMLDGQYGEAIESARKAVAVNTNSADAYASLALVLTYAGRQAEAIPAMEAALRLEPNPPVDILSIWGQVLFMNHDYAQALDVLRRALAVQGSRKWTGDIRLFLAMTHAELGQLEQAREIVQRMQRLTALRFWNLSYFRLHWAHYKQIDLLLNALRKAGMPEWPSGYEDVAGEHLRGAAIGELLSGANWFGRSLNKYELFTQKIGEDGKISYWKFGRSWEGEVSVEEDKLCYQIPALVMGRKFCGYVYRNPQGTPKNNNEYISVDVFDVHHFSLRS